MKMPALINKRKSFVETLVQKRKGEHEEKVEVARLRENLVLEEFDMNVEDIYDFSGGKRAKEVGGFGEVQVVRHRKTGANFAMKTVALSRLKTKAAFDLAVQEVDLLKSLDHPNIVRLQEVYVTPSHLYVAMDLVKGGNLAVRYSFEGEEKAAHVVRQIARALRYLHDRNIAHRDLKLENILLEHAGPGAAVKLVDFGLSAIFEEDGVSHDILGSWDYIAPEVIVGKSRPAEADMWALGVVAYILMSGKRPFDDIDTHRIKQRISTARYKFAGEIWSIASEDSKHFIRSLLQKTPRLRLTVAQAQEHRWLRKAEEISQEPRGDLQFAEGMMRSLLDFREAKPMKQLALEVVARTLDPAEIRHLAREFDRADNTNNGEVSLKEFKRWIAANQFARSMSEEDVEALFKSVDVDQTGLIHFNEFLAATIRHHSLDEAQLKAAFDRLDRSHTGFISVEDLTLTTGAAANAEESAVLLAQFDFKGDDKISFEEFVKGMRRIDTKRDEKKMLVAPKPTSSSMTLPPSSSMFYQPSPTARALSDIADMRSLESAEDGKNLDVSMQLLNFSAGADAQGPVEVSKAKTNIDGCTAASTRNGTLPAFQESTAGVTERMGLESKDLRDTPLIMRLSGDISRGMVSTPVTKNGEVDGADKTSDMAAALEVAQGGTQGEAVVGDQGPSASSERNREVNGAITTRCLQQEAGRESNGTSTGCGCTVA